MKKSLTLIFIFILATSCLFLFASCKKDVDDSVPDTSIADTGNSSDTGSSSDTGNSSDT